MWAKFALNLKKQWSKKCWHENNSGNNQFSVIEKFLPKISSPLNENTQFLAKFSMDMMLSTFHWIPNWNCWLNCHCAIDAQSQQSKLIVQRIKARRQKINLCLETSRSRRQNWLPKQDNSYCFWLPKIILVGTLSRCQNRAFKGGTKEKKPRINTKY